MPRVAHGPRSRLAMRGAAFDPPVYRQGEPMYPIGDPRARALLNYCEEVLAGEKAFKRLKRALSVIREVNSIEPSNALVCIFLTQRLGLPSRIATLSSFY